jgi:hypothetical protein
MTDPSSYPDTDDDIEVPPDPASRRGMPRWVKVSGLVAAVLVLVFVVAQLTGAGGEHGPGRHSGGDAPPAGVTDDEDGGHTPPPGMEHGG